MPVISMLTIGQTPREDIARDLRQLLPDGWELRQYGALDGLTRRQAEAQLGYDCVHSPMISACQSLIIA